MWRAFFTKIVVLLLLGGCKAATTNQGSETPAIIPVHSQDSLSELRMTIKRALNDTSILIGTKAFNKSSRLLIERRPIKGPNGRIIDTRTTEEPIIFNLVLDGNRCYLIDTRNSNRYQLLTAKCEPA